MSAPASTSSAQQTRSASRRERLLDAALHVFTQTGYRDASMDDIASAADTSKGGLYFHFPGKQALFLALLTHMADLLLLRTRAAMQAEVNPLARGDAALRTVLHTFASHRRLTHLFLVEALGAGREFNEVIVRMHQEFASLIASYLDTLVSDGRIAPLDTHLASLAWFGAINEVVTHWVLTGYPADLEATYPALHDLLLHGVYHPPTSTETESVQ